MRLSCPTCNSEFTPDVLITHQLARQAIVRLVRLSLPFSASTLQYVALFKPASRALTFDRIATLVEELHADITRGAITRKGRDWPADVDTWKAAIDVVLAKRDAHDLRLPLASHALLHEVIVGLVEKTEARSEAQRITDQRSQRITFHRGGVPRDLGDLAADIAASVVATPPTHTVVITNTSAPDYSKPSRAALEIRARIEAARRPPLGTYQDPVDPPTEGPQP